MSKTLAETLIEVAKICSDAQDEASINDSLRKHAENDLTKKAEELKKAIDQIRSEQSKNSELLKKIDDYSKLHKSYVRTIARLKQRGKKK